jgi:hypothetical protein
MCCWCCVMLRTKRSFRIRPKKQLGFTLCFLKTNILEIIIIAGDINMYSQKKLVGGIHSFSPTKEKWIAKSVENLPEKVTVHFKTGQTGFLDMKNLRAVHWARIIDELERTKQPVYVEIDMESNVITNVLIPELFKVERLDPDEHGNLMVRLQPSSAIHLLLQSDPNFESMRDSLQAALNEGSERLVTETRDEHEIIDVRKPEDSAVESPSPESPPPPTDPPVSETRAGELFTNMNNESCEPCDPAIDLEGAKCIPFLFPDDGCWIRAHIMCHLMRAGGPNTNINPPEDPCKVWIDFPGVSYVPTPNHPDCQVPWGWHVAPTLQVVQPEGNQTWVVDPSVSPAPEFKNDWRDRQNPSASLQEGPWTDYNWFNDNNGNSVSLDQAHQYMQRYRHRLYGRCLDFGPPPYSCTRGCFFIIDRSTFSDDEIEAMLHISSPAVIQSAFYIVVDGFKPYDLGFTTATMQHTPTLTISLTAGMTITPVRLEFEYPTHLNRRQRLTWVYDISFADTSAFTNAPITVTLQASMSDNTSRVDSIGYLYLIQQPEPYETDGETSWLSTDLRVFQIKAGDPMKFGADIRLAPTDFITQVITNLNTENWHQTFNNIQNDQQTLELSSTVNGTPVYNFAVAKVRYRSQNLPANNVRVFFRLFPATTTSLEYNQGTAYRRSPTGEAPLLGIKNNEVTAIPCFASPRINSAVASMTSQTDAPNVQTIPAESGGTEVIRYFGCWLDINQTQPQFPLQLPVINRDGPFTSGRVSIQDHIRNEHQCLVAEIVFGTTPSNGATPSVSDKLAQRNLAIVQSANPGLVFSRRISQTFDIRPSTSRQEHDELMIDWGNIPEGSVATFYLPGIAASDILRLAARKYRSHRLVRIDEHTLKCDTGGITYLPIPFTDANLAGMLTVDLPEGIKKGQVFKAVVRQVTGEPQPIILTHAIEAADQGWRHTVGSFQRHIVGSFQLTIPVHDKAEILPGQQRLLSNLRWIERAIPANDRWSPVFSKYVLQIADRVDALGGDSTKVGSSSSGQWQEAYRNCHTLTLVIIALIAVFFVGVGAFTGGLMATINIVVFTLLTGTVRFWTNNCRPTKCQVLRVLLTGSGIGAIILALLVVFGLSTPQLISTLIVSIGVTAVTTFVSWVKGCFN